jgi:hypothetical protein
MRSRLRDCFTTCATLHEFRGKAEKNSTQFWRPPRGVRTREFTESPEETEEKILTSKEVSYNNPAHSNYFSHFLSYNNS